MEFLMLFLKVDFSFWVEGVSEFVYGDTEEMDKFKCQVGDWALNFWWSLKM